jgi:chromosome segregation ATPase
MAKTLNDMTREFLFNEGEKREPSLKSYIQALEENLLKFESRTNTESRRLEIASEQIRGIKRAARKLEEKLFLLENENVRLQEDLNLLQEKKENLEK